jgi:hypothetical protein
VETDLGAPRLKSRRIQVAVAVVVEQKEDLGTKLFLAKAVHRVLLSSAIVQR